MATQVTGTRRLGRAITDTNTVRGKDRDRSPAAGKVRPLIRSRRAEALSGFKQTTMWEREQAGLFPPRIRLSSRMNVWPEDEIAAVNAAIIAGRSDDEIRSLVKRLVAARTLPDRAG
jgi:prophage regulatory protein